MEKRHHIKDPGSAITHFIGMLMAIFAAVPLLIKAAHEPSRIYIGSLTVYAISLILLYAASTTYHTFDISPKVNTILKKIDHMMISVLIAGSYTPVCLLVVKGTRGITLLCIVWAFAIAGILIKAFIGCFVRNGSPLSSTLVWDGPVFWLFLRSSIICPLPLLHGFLPEELFIL